MKQWNYMGVLKVRQKNENVPDLEITEAKLIQCNVVDNGYQQKSRVLYTFVLKKSVGQLLDVFPEHFKNIWFRIFVYWSMVYRSEF